MPGLLRERLERELAGDRLRRLRADLAREHLGGLAGRLEVGLRRDPAVRERADEAVQELPGTALDERAGALHVGGTDELVDRRRTVRALDPLLERDAEPALDVAAQLGQRVELARRARKLVVDLRQAPSR